MEAGIQTITATPIREIISDKVISDSCLQKKYVDVIYNI